MDDKIFTIFGYLASANACLMMIPQVYITLKKKSFEDVSIQMIYMNLLTQCLFFPYLDENFLQFKKFCFSPVTSKDCWGNSDK